MKYFLVNISDPILHIPHLSPPDCCGQDLLLLSSSTLSPLFVTRSEILAEKIFSSKIIFQSHVPHVEDHQPLGC